MKSSVPRAYRVVDVFYQRAQFLQPPGLQFKAEYIDYDGEKLGAVEHSLFIPEFEGVKYLHDLSVCPINYLPNRMAVIDELKIRGGVFLNLRGRHFKFYNGVASPLEKSKNLFKVSKTASLMETSEEGLNTALLRYGLASWWTL